MNEGTNTFCGRPARTRTVIVVISVLLTAVIACLASGVAITVLLPAVQQVRETQRRQEASENLRQLGDALRLYHQEADAMQRNNGGPVGSAEPASAPNAEDDVD